MLVFSLVFAAAFAAAVQVALAVTVEIAPSAETCAWYLKWPDEKIRAYATDCLTRLPADYPRARRIPFIAVTRNNWCRNKTAAATRWGQTLRNPRGLRL